MNIKQKPHKFFAITEVKKMKMERIFEPTERYPSSHCSTLALLPNGDLLCAWFAGSREKGRDVVILMARKPAGADKWEPPVVAADTPGYAEGNSVLFFYPPKQELWFFFETMFGSGEGMTKPWTGWTTCDIKRKISTDGGHTFGPEEIFEGELGYIIRCRPMILADGTIIVPAHDERDWSSLFYLSSDGGKTWEKSQVIQSGLGFKKGNIEPSVVQFADGELLALMRTGDKDHGIMESRSSDNGRTWTPPRDIGLPNPDAAIDILLPPPGERLLLAYNPVSSGRTPLSLAWSLDRGKTWKKWMDLETAEGEYSYPYMIRDPKNNVVHISHTWRRETIIHREIEIPES